MHPAVAPLFSKRGETWLTPPKRQVRLDFASDAYSATIPSSTLRRSMSSECASDSSMALRPLSPQAALPNEVQDSSVRVYVEETLAALVRELSLSPPEGQPSVTLRCRATPADCVINPASGALETVQGYDSYCTYSWPGRTAFESWKFTVIIRILAVVDQALRQGQLISKRDIYYIDPAYFGTQEAVNSVIDDLAYTIGVSRIDLNVEAAAKGLIAGSFCLIRESDVLLDARSASEDTLIPQVQDDDEINVSGTRWILIIEKEAVFHRLVRNSYHTTALAGEGILVTGKGYPDICTRRFLHQLFQIANNGNQRPPRFYALVDGDPHGMGIMSTYKYGSLAHVHENERLIVPELHWLGLKVTDAMAETRDGNESPLLPLTAADRRRITAMLRQGPIWASDGPEPEWRLELQRMLMLNVKVEIESLYNGDGGIEAWIDSKMFRQK